MFNNPFFDEHFFNNGTQSLKNPITLVTLYTVDRVAQEPFGISLLYKFYGSREFELNSENSFLQKFLGDFFSRGGQVQVERYVNHNGRNFALYNPQGGQIATLIVETVDS